MREIRLSGSEGGAAQLNAPCLPLSCLTRDTILLKPLAGLRAARRMADGRRPAVIQLGGLAAARR